LSHGSKRAKKIKKNQKNQKIISPPNESHCHSFAIIVGHISSGMKQRALQLLLVGCDLDGIVKFLGVSAKSIFRWNDNDERYKFVLPTSVTCGRCLLTPTMLDDLKALILESLSLFLDELSKGLAMLSLYQQLSFAKISRTLVYHTNCSKGQRNGIKQDQEARLCNVLLNLAADRLNFFNESSKDNRMIFCRYGRAMAVLMDILLFRFT
jgi:hypothetical protein